MLKSMRLSEVESAVFSAAWGVYEASFPRSERRTLACHAAAMEADSGFVCLCLYDAAGLVGILFYWEFSDCVYVEHLAIAEHRRGTGCGRRVLELLQRLGLPIVLEIEPVEDAATARRWRFYERAGYRRLPVEHWQLPYRRGCEAVRLVLLCYPAEAAAALIPSFEREYLARPMQYREA